MLNSWLYCSGREQVLVRSRELRAHQQRLDAADDEEDEGRDEVAQADRLVVDAW